MYNTIFRIKGTQKVLNEYPFNQLRISQSASFLQIRPLSGVQHGARMDADDRLNDLPPINPHHFLASIDRSTVRNRNSIFGSMKFRLNLFAPKYHRWKAFQNAWHISTAYSYSNSFMELIRYSKSGADTYFAMMEALSRADRSGVSNLVSPDFFKNMDKHITKLENSNVKGKFEVLPKWKSSLIALDFKPIPPKNRTMGRMLIRLSGKQIAYLEADDGTVLSGQKEPTDFDYFLSFCSFPDDIDQRSTLSNQKKGLAWKLYLSAPVDGLLQDSKQSTTLENSQETV